MDLARRRVISKKIEGRDGLKEGTRTSVHLLEPEVE